MAGEKTARRRGAVATATAWACAVAATLVLTPAPAGAVETAPIVGAVPSTAWSVDGRVWATVIVGDTVIVGGNFTSALGPGGQSVARRNLAAFTLSTGEPLLGWKADAGSTVRALEAHGEWVYVGGAFGRVGGLVNERLAKVRVADGYVDRTFRASFDAPVRALDLHHGKLWVGGAFTQVNGVERRRVARIDAATGALDTAFRATPNGDVWGLVAHPSRPVVYVSGNFSTVNGTGRTGVAGLSDTGTLDPVVFALSARPTLGLDIDASGSRLFGAGGSGTNTMAAWNTTTGARVWRHVVMGDVQAVTHHGGRVWFGFHDGYQQNTTVKVLAADAVTGQIDQTWRPAFDMFWGVFAIGVSDAGVVVGGEFSRVSGVSARGWARFPGTVTPNPDPAPVPPPVPEPAPALPALPASLTADSPWRFSDSGSRPDAWATPGFDDSGWSSGLPEFGYGDGDEKTLLGWGPRASARHITSYFRAEFGVAGTPSGARLELIADDGAVVHVNGVEVARDNMPSGAVGQDTRAASNRSGRAETRFTTVTVPASALRVGRNVIAVEVHQDQPGSSDLSFSATLTPLS